MQMSRRTFLVQTGTVAALYPMIGMLESCTPNERDRELLAKGIQINQESGINLTMYFFNLKFLGNDLVPDRDGSSYIIVQIPPQSLHEKYFIQPAPNTPPNKQQEAFLSGHSFLAFELWPDWKYHKKRRIRYRTAELTNWQDPNYFKLLSTFDQSNNFQNFNTLDNSLDEVKLNNAIINPVAEKTLIEINHYKNIISKLLGNESHHLTIFELPAGLLLAPHKRNKKITIEVIQNDYTISDQTFWVYPKNENTIKRRILERGNFELRFIEQDKDNKKSPISVPPSLRAIGIFSTVRFQTRTSTDPCACLAAGISNDNYLPSLLDEGELLFLNQQSNTEERFDIKVKGPFLLGSTGATLKFSYNNHDLDGIDPSISLVEYEHHFQEGRDNFIKVARIGAIAPTSQKALHVKIAERKEIDGISFIDYKEFVEIIETDKMFPPPSDKTRNGIDYLGPGIAGSELQHYDNQIHFSRIETRFKRTPPIKVVNECLNHFWVYTEFAQGNPAANIDLMQLEFDYYDKNGKKTEKAVKHPIFFMRRDFFCSIDMTLLLQQKMADFDDGVKLRMALQDQLIAFTPDDPTVVDGSPKTDNKINQLAAEYSDYYFTIAQPQAGVQNIFDKAQYVIYPQISRAKVYIEHYQQYSQSPLPSLVKYNKAYLGHYFDTNENGAKVLLEQSADFVKGEILNFLGVKNTDLENITALNLGYNRIVEVFNEAGDRVGGMINPGIRNKLIAFGEQALTYPANINEQWKTVDNPIVKGIPVDKVLKSIDIFSTDAEVVGVRLIDILGEISEAGGTPGFAADKLMAQIENFKKYITDLTSNAIVLNAIQKIEAANTEILKLKETYDNVKALLTEAATKLNAAKDAFLLSVPDVNKIKTAAKLAFEKERLKAFTVADAWLDKAIETAKDEVIREIYNLRPDFSEFDTYLTQKEVTFRGILSKLITNLTEGEEQLKARLEILKSDASLFTDIRAAATQLNRPLAQLRTVATPILIGVNFETYFSEDLSSKGLFIIQKEYDGLLARYTAGETAVLAELTTAKNRLIVIQNTINHSLYEKIKTIVSCYHELIKDLSSEAEKAAAERFFALLRLLSKASISYYVDRCIEFDRDFKDLIGTTASQLKDISTNVQVLAVTAAQNRETELKKYIQVIIQANPSLEELQTTWNSVGVIEDDLLSNIEKTIIKEIVDAALPGAVQARLVKDLKVKYDAAVNQADTKLREYKAKLVGQAKNVVDQIEREMQEKLKELNDANEIKDAVTEFNRVKKIFTTPKTEEFKYQWETGNFKTANLGILKFSPQSNPPTRLKADVRTIVHINPLNFPNVIDKIDTYAENSLTNFSLTFLSALTVDFAHLNFVTGSSVKTNMNVSIRDVKFDGALSFVQKLEELMGGLGDGFSLSIQPSSVGIGYTSPVFSISTPGFVFSNISISVMLQIFFDRRPMELTFMLAKPEAKATIAAGIYGGGFYCALTAQPKNGLKSIEMALEMGALLGIQLGPIKGEVRFMIGLFFRKDDTGVILEGYFIAEGVLSVWIINVSARLYMYVRSQNSCVTGGCKATYSAKLGLIKKSFSGSYSKKLAGAESKRSSKEQNALLKLTNEFINTEIDTFDFSFLSDEYQPMSASEWKKFHKTFYRH